MFNTARYSLTADSSLTVHHVIPAKAMTHHYHTTL